MDGEHVFTKDQVTAIQCWHDALVWWRRRSTVPIYRPDDQSRVAANAHKLRNELNLRKVQCVLAAIRLVPEWFSYEYDDRCTSYCRVRFAAPGLQLYTPEKSMYVPWGAVRGVLTGLGIEVDRP